MAKERKPLSAAEEAERIRQDDFFSSVEIAPDVTVLTSDQLAAVRAAADGYYKDLTKRRAAAPKESRTPPPKPTVFRKRVFFTAYMEAQYRALHALWEKRLISGKRDKSPEKAAAAALKKAAQLAEIVAALRAQGAGDDAKAILARLGL